MSLEGLSRKEVQAIAKERGLKANKATDVLIKEILAWDVEKAGGSTEPFLPDEECDEPEAVDVKKRHATTEPILWNIGDEVQMSDGKHGVITRLNKKSARLQLAANGKEVTVKFEDIFKPPASVCVKEADDFTEDLKDHIAKLIPMNIPLDASVDMIEDEIEVTEEREAEVPPEKSPVVVRNYADAYGPFSHSHELLSIIAKTKAIFSPQQRVERAGTPYKLCGTPAIRISSCRKVFKINKETLVRLSFGFYFHRQATPSSLRKPSIIPSSTKSQTLRQEASLVKKRNFEEIQKQVHSCIILSCRCR